MKHITSIKELSKHNSIIYPFLKGIDVIQKLRGCNLECRKYDYSSSDCNCEKYEAIICTGDIEIDCDCLLERIDTLKELGADIDLDNEETDRVYIKLPTDKCPEKLIDIMNYIVNWRVGDSEVVELDGSTWITLWWD
jgi:hypothetical protein